jgi:hypothetical protein
VQRYRYKEGKSSEINGKKQKRMNEKERRDFYAALDDSIQHSGKEALHT